jgi:hypothetical protein
MDLKELGVSTHTHTHTHTQIHGQTDLQKPYSNSNKLCFCKSLLRCDVLVTMESAALVYTATITLHCVPM